MIESASEASRRGSSLHSQPRYRGFAAGAYDPKVSLLAGQCSTCSTSLDIRQHGGSVTKGRISNLPQMAVVIRRIASIYNVVKNIDLPQLRFFRFS